MPEPDENEEVHVPKKGECPECEANLKDNLRDVACSDLPPAEKDRCEKAVEEYFKKPEVSPEGFVNFMKDRGLWDDE